MSTPKRPRRPLPTRANPYVYTLGWGVEVQSPTGWVGPDGVQDVPYWWAKRGVAEKLALGYVMSGRHAEVMHGTRRRDCTAEAADPWEPGYDPAKATVQCGVSIAWEPAENLTATRQGKRAARELARATARAARADARERRAQAKARPSYAKMPGASGDVAAIKYLLRHGLEDDEGYGAVAYLEGVDRRYPLKTDEGYLDTDALRDMACGLAADLVHSDMPAARDLVRALGRGTCRTTEELMERVAKERRELAARIRARERSPYRPRAAARAAAPQAELPARAARKAAGAAQREAKAAAKREAKAAAAASKMLKAREREAKAAARREAAAEREAAKAARASKREASWEKRERAKAAKAAKAVEAAERAAAREARAAVEAARRAPRPLMEVMESPKPSPPARNRRSEAAAAAMSRRVNARAAARAAEPAETNATLAERQKRREMELRNAAERDFEAKAARDRAAHLRETMQRATEGATEARARGDYRAARDFEAMARDAKRRMEA